MRTIQVGLACGLCLLALGCGSKYDDRPTVHPVKGTLRVAGEPATDAVVVLYPVGAPHEPLVRPHATVQSDGSFHLTTFSTRDGAPVGDYAVTVTWPGPPVKGQGEDEPGPDRLHQRYNNVKKPAASIHIGPDTAELAMIDLKPVNAKAKPVAGLRAGMEQ